MTGKITVKLSDTMGLLVASDGTEYLYRNGNSSQRIGDTVSFTLVGNPPCAVLN